MTSFDFAVFAAACALILVILCTALFTKYAAMKRKQDEREGELIGERNLYNSIYNSTEDIYIVLNAANQVPSYVSSGTRELMGIKRADIVADIYALRRGVVAKDISGFKEEYAKWNKQGTFTREFEFIKMETGEKKVGKVSIHYNPQEDNLYIAIKDITAEAEDRRDIQNELEHIKNLNKYRNEFLSNISHEIRTPINSIQGQLKLAGMNAENPKEVKRYTEGVSEQTEKLLLILNDMFDISKMEAGDTVLENKEFDIKALAKKLEDTYVDSTQAKGQTFSINISDLKVRYFMGDAMRLQQILIAFIEHAQEVTPKGGKISIGIRQMNKSGYSANLLFRIKDMGERVSQHDAMELLGTGSGGNISLAVANQLINVMGGQVMFNSDESGNDYSLFISLPLSDRTQDMDAPIDTADSKINKSFTFEGCKILLAEDNEMNAEIAKEVLEMMGADVDIAENGQIAVDKFMSGGAGRYDVILMDIQMPVMDGLQATRKIRSLYGAEAKTIPIFALSANAFLEDKNRSLEAGMNGHIAKPVDLETLFEMMARTIKQTP